MRDFIPGIIITAVLAVLFSIFCPDHIHITLPAGGYGPQYPGDSGPVLPGGAALPAEVSASASDTEHQAPATAPEPPTAPEDTQQPTQTAQTDQTTQTAPNESEEPQMNEMLIFWHGVAAVLLGETAALAVAIAWMQIQIHNARHGVAHHKEEMK